jgi:5-formyltetrahydrofolate cyclo-ligase
VQAGELDLVIVPGLAFDRQCWRLGHGKGYYDRFLASMQDRHGHMPATGKTDVTVNLRQHNAVALALDDQIMGDGEIPHEEHDIRPQCLATPAALITNLMMNE